MTDSKKKPESHWRAVLTPEQYRVTRQKGTELPHSGEYNDHSEEGIYKCVCCGTELFSSDAKYDAGCGWPSFSQANSKEKIETQTDLSNLQMRTEILCKDCGSHLGHVFDDGPTETGQRFCVNSASLSFDKKKKP